MTNRPETKNVISGVDLSYLRDDVKRGDTDRGYYSATPGTFGDRIPNDRSANDMGPDAYFGDDSPTRHGGQIEDESFHETHGETDEFGFVRRPTYRSDVERS